jgi:hypothetical protein
VGIVTLSRLRMTGSPLKQVRSCSSLLRRDSSEGSLHLSRERLYRETRFRLLGGIPHYECQQQWGLSGAYVPSCPSLTCGLRPAYHPTLRAHEALRGEQPANATQNEIWTIGRRRESPRIRSSSPISHSLPWIAC